MFDWVVRAHPYLASITFLVLWCAIGYLEGRFISPVFACVAWSLAILGATLAVVEVSGLGPLRWGLAIAILLGGAAWMIYYYDSHVRNGGVTR